jgi:hypothetical protein
MLDSVKELANDRFEAERDFHAFWFSRRRRRPQPLSPS